MGKNSLFGRMVLIMISGLVIAQIFTTAIFFQERVHFGLRTATRHVEVRIAEIVQILDRLPASERTSIAQASCIGNLLDNAWKYGRQVKIIVADSSQALHVSVCDDGPGIPDGQIDKVFEPFYRVEESRNRTTGGTGLGLSIARNAARANGGDLLLRNRPEGGFEAVLRLPR